MTFPPTDISLFKFGRTGASKCLLDLFFLKGPCRGSTKAGPGELDLYRDRIRRWVTAFVSGFQLDLVERLGRSNSEGFLLLGCSGCLHLYSSRLR